MGDSRGLRAARVRRLDWRARQGERTAQVSNTNACCFLVPAHFQHQSDGYLCVYVLIVLRSDVIEISAEFARCCGIVRASLNETMLKLQLTHSCVFKHNVLLTFA